jgi:hypothetical protein
MKLLYLVELIATDAASPSSIRAFTATKEKSAEVIERLGIFIKELEAIALPRPFTNLKDHWVHDFGLAQKALIAGDKEMAAQDFIRVARSCRGMRKYRMDLEEARLILSNMPESRPLSVESAPRLLNVVAEVRKGLLTPVSASAKRLFDFDFQTRYAQKVADDIDLVTSAIEGQANVLELKEYFEQACARF